MNAFARPALCAVPMLLAGCMMTPTASTGPVALDQPQRLGGLTITPLAIVEDSRCPINARCIWAGRLVVRAAIAGGYDRLERNFTLGEVAQTDFGPIRLDSATPGRTTQDGEIPSPAYRVHFSFAPRP
ncbi:hypothetical protein [Sphingomonas sp.]|uniref:hypothetical protein n=1 Tax=Sphingomonas sp. TaxID=28214 RepID=UPI001EC5E5D8|nr:hypothetical protein [Sphingomonas sp.]MBX3594499.1 hypothetical protein [Sphingomonas sp.]